MSRIIINKLIISVLCVLLACPSLAQAFSFVAAAHADGATSAETTCVPAVPTGTANGDILLMFGKRAGVTADPSGVPSGWTVVANKNGGGTASSFWLYYKIASGESGSYTWTWAATDRTGCSVVAYRSDFNVASVSDITVSNTNYVTSDTTVRAASMTVPNANSPVIFFGAYHVSSAGSLTTPASPAGFTSNVNDQFNSNSRFEREIASMVWSGSGATGNIDSTAGSTITDKHAFAIALKPASTAVSTRNLTTTGAGD